MRRKLREVLFFFRSLLGRGRAQSDLDDEVEFHLGMKIRDLCADGMSQEEARKVAHKEFGKVDTTKEACREAWGTRVVTDLIHDIRFSVRSLKKARGYSVTVIATLALCIGANTSIFSILSNVLLKPYPYPEADQLVQLGEVRMNEDGSDTLGRISPRKYLERKDLDVFESIGLYRTGGDNLYFNGHSFRVRTGRVTPSFFETLQVSPLLGRVFVEGESEPGNTNVVILTYELWKTAFNGDREIVGQRVDIEGMTFEVVGVMPKEFRFIAQGVMLWRPQVFTDYLKSDRGWNWNRMSAIARLKPGVSIEQAQAELNVLDASAYQAYPDRQFYIDRVGLQSRLIDYHSYRTEDSKEILYLLQVSVIVVLMIGCANVVNLVFAKTLARMQEISLRISLGARWGRIIRMFLVEGVIYGAVAGLLGFLLGLVGLGLINQYGLHSSPRFDSLSIDGTVLLYDLLLVVFVGIVIGIVPVSILWKKGLVRLVREGGRTATSSKGAIRARQILAAGQVALTCVLLIATGLLVSSLGKILNNETGFQTENLVSASLELPNSSNPQEQLDYGARLLKRFSEIPGVRSVALNTSVPFFGFFGSVGDFHIEGRQYSASDPHPSFAQSITQGRFFETVGIPLLQGRAFTDEDMIMGAPLVAVIDQRVADLHFPGENPLGKRLTGDLAGPFSARSDARWATIVGVVGSVKATELNENLDELNPFIYVNAGAIQTQAQRFVMRVTGGSGFNLEAFRARVRVAMSEVRDTVPSSQLQSMSYRIDATVADRRAVLRFLATFGGLALLLSAIGVYGILSYSVALRRKELGIRSAMGASRGEILNTVLFQGMQLAVIGLVVGLAVAVNVMPLIKDRLYETGAFNAVVYSGVAALLAIVAFAASFIPARRAARANPLTALRYE